MRIDNLIYEYDSGIEGADVAIMAGVHGDEVGGVYAFFWLRDEFLPANPIKKGKLKLILANLKAIELNQRFVDIDLNRVFHREEGDEYEVKRVQEIKKALLGVEYALDLHSTSRPSQPMTCAENSHNHLKITQAMPVKYMVTNWEGRVVGLTSDGFVDGNGGFGVTLECGQHLSPDAKHVAKVGALNFLKVLGMIEGEIEQQHKPVEVYLFETFYPQTVNFTFTVKAESFVSIKKGEQFAIDGDKKYMANEDCVMVMPNKIIIPGIEAGYLGRIIEHNN